MRSIRQGTREPGAILEYMPQGATVAFPRMSIGSVLAGIGGECE